MLQDTSYRNLQVLRQTNQFWTTKHDYYVHEKYLQGLLTFVWCCRYGNALTVARITSWPKISRYGLIRVQQSSDFINLSIISRYFNFLYS